MRGVEIIRRRIRNILDIGPIVVGQVIKSDNASRTVKVVKMELNPKYYMYFNKSLEVFCTDKTNQSKNGDIVLIKKIEKPEKIFERYAVHEVLYKIGTTIDPFENDKVSNSAKA